MQKKLRMTKFLFQDDNATAHRADIVKKAKKDLNIVSLPEWPANSPDLSPIEIVWAELKKRIKRRAPKTIADIKLIAQDEWSKIPLSFIQKRILLIPTIIQEIIRVGGDVTKY